MTNFSFFTQTLESKGRLEEFILRYNLRQEIAQAIIKGNDVIEMVIEAPNHTRINVTFSDLEKDVNANRYETLTDLNKDFDRTLYNGLKRALDEFDPITECEKYHMNVEDLTKEKILKEIDEQYLKNVLFDICPKGVKLEQWLSDCEIRETISGNTDYVYKLEIQTPIQDDDDLEDIINNAKRTLQIKKSHSSSISLNETTYDILDVENVEYLRTNISFSELIDYIETYEISY
ncbi:hypothetical protein ACR56S_11825 [Staphylococcus hominis]|uniref:hypothetical protein n=1 Tax=Staphylococcus hominis TaxID=1290 RepID=UPI003DA0CA53